MVFNSGKSKKERSFKSFAPFGASGAQFDAKNSVREHGNSYAEQHKTASGYAERRQSSYAAQKGAYLGGYEKPQGSKSNDGYGDYANFKLTADTTAAELLSFLSGILRPSVDNAIDERYEAMAQNRGSIDADAAARGMSGSTLVSSLKQRESESAQDDIENLEAGYQATLSEKVFSALFEVAELKNERDKLEQEQRQLEQQQKQYESDLRYKYSALNGRNSGGSGGSGGDSQDGEQSDELEGSGILSKDADIALLCVKNMSDPDKISLFTSDIPLWTVKRNTLIENIGKSLYNDLRKYYMRDMPSGRGVSPRGKEEDAWL